MKKWLRRIRGAVGMGLTWAAGWALVGVLIGVTSRLPRVGAWGAVGGLLLSLVPAALVAVGLASVEGPDGDLWQITAAISGPFTLLSAVSASGSLMLARMAQPWRTLLVQLLAGDQSDA